MRSLSSVVSSLWTRGPRGSVALDQVLAVEGQPVTGVVELRGGALPVWIRSVRARVVCEAEIPRQDFPVPEQRVSVLAESRIPIERALDRAEQIRVPFAVELPASAERLCGATRERHNLPEALTVRHRLEIEAELPSGRRALTSVELPLAAQRVSA